MGKINLTKRQIFGIVGSIVTGVILISYIANMTSKELKNKPSPLPSIESFDSTIGQPTLSAIIIEPRKHKDLEYVITNAHSFLGDEVHIHLFHGKNANPCENSELCKLIQKKIVIPHALEVDNMDAHEYSKFTTSDKLWNHITTDKALIFQTDSVFCSATRERIENFLHLDYVGSSVAFNAPTHSVPNRPDGFLIDGGNGGFSLRDTKLSRLCSRPMDSNYYSRFSKYIPGEDAYFIDCIRKNGGKLGSQSEQQRFGTQNHFWKHSLGAHQINNQLKDEKERTRFRKYCPEYLDSMK